MYKIGPHKHRMAKVGTFWSIVGNKNYVMFCQIEECRFLYYWNPTTGKIWKPEFNASGT